MSERQRGLGRGLSALMGEQVAEPVAVDGSAPAPAGVTMAALELVHPNPDQPRKTFRQEELEDLAASIRDKGVIQPILVRNHPNGVNGWQIVAGERRWRAAQLARLTEVPVIVREIDAVTMQEIAIVENVQRVDLNPLEEAEAYKGLMENYAHTQDSVAGVVGKSRSHVANTLRLLQLPEAVLSHVRDGRLTAGHARALIGLENASVLAERIVAEGMNVRQAEALARQAAAGDKPKSATSKPAPEGAADIAALEQDLSDALGVAVQLKDRNGKGELLLRYGSLEQLDDLCRRLMK